MNRFSGAISTLVLITGLTSQALASGVPNASAYYECLDAVVRGSRADVSRVGVVTEAAEKDPALELTGFAVSAVRGRKQGFYVLTRSSLFFYRLPDTPACVELKTEGMGGARHQQAKYLLFADESPVTGTIKLSAATPYLCKQFARKTKKTSGKRAWDEEALLTLRTAIKATIEDYGAENVERFANIKTAHRYKPTLRARTAKAMQACLSTGDEAVREAVQAHVRELSKVDSEFAF